MTNKKPQPPKKRVEVAEVETPAEVEVEVVEEVIDVEEVEVETPVEIIEPAPAPVTFVQAPPTTYAVVGAGDRDDVSLSKVVYKNTYAKKSLSVHHIQRRLKERGYDQAYLDKDGYYGDLTYTAMKQFQKDQGLADTGIADLETLTKLFEGDDNVRVTP